MTWDFGSGNSGGNEADKLNRRAFLGSTLASGLVIGVGLSPTVAGQEENEDERSGEQIVSSATLSDADVDSLVETIATDEFYDAVSDSTYDGEVPQIESFEADMQEFPREGDAQVVLSSGQAADATKDPGNFASTDVNGRTIPNYSPDNYTAHDVAELEVDFTIPEDAQGIALDFQFASDESPGYIGSQFQDFCEILLFLPDGSVSNIGTLPNGNAVTVDNATDYSNVPNGGSQNPEEPLPDPPDITYNAVTQLLTAKRSVAGFEGQEARLVVRVADASDSVYDSAILFDNLRFEGDVEESVGPVEQALNTHRDTLVSTIEDVIRIEAETEAEIYNEHGSEYAETLLEYQGYTAGVIDKSELDAEVREILDKTTTQIDGDTTAAATDSYNFYAELYEKAETADPENLADLFEQYLLGTHPEQNHYIEIGGMTPAEAIANYEEDVFPAYKSAFLADLEENDYTNAEIQQITSFISSRTSYLESVRGESDRLADDTVDALVGDGDITGQSFGVDVEKTTQSNTVEQDGLVTTPIVVVGSIILHKIAVTSLLAKGYASLKAAASGFKIVKIAKGSQILTSAASTLTKGKAAATYGLHAWQGLLPSALPSAGSAAAGGLKAKLLYVTGEVSKGYVLESLLPAEAAAATSPGALVTWGLDQVVDDIDTELEGQAGAMPDACLSYSQREAEITELTVSNVNITDAINLFGEEDLYHREDGKWFGVQSGSVTLKNTGPEAFTPNPQFKIRALNTTPAGKDVDTQFPIVFNDPIPELEPGEEKTVDIEYASPLSGKGTSSFQMVAALKNSDTEVTEEFDTGYFEFDFGSSFDLFSGSLGSGESVEEVHEPSSETKTATYELNYDQGDLDLHISDDQGNHAGMNYETNTFENQIPGLSHSGDDGGALGNEYATISEIQSSEYTVEAVAPEIGTVIQESGSPSSVSSAESGSGISADFDANVTEVSESELEATIDVSSSAATAYADTAGEAVTTELMVSEVKQTAALDNVQIDIEPLTAESVSGSISPDNITIGSEGFAVSSGTTTQVDVDIVLPDDIETGTYTGQVQASANTGETTDTTEVSVQVFPEGPDVAIGSGQNPPQDLDEDGLYEDVSGDGTFSMADVQLLFDNLDTDAIQNHPAAFNFAGEENPDDVTVGDVQALYNKLNGA